jgi:hypothetical protein
MVFALLKYRTAGIVLKCKSTHPKRQDLRVEVFDRRDSEMSKPHLTDLDTFCHWAVVGKRRRLVTRGMLLSVIRAGRSPDAVGAVWVEPISKTEWREALRGVRRPHPCRRPSPGTILLAGLLVAGSPQCAGDRAVLKRKSVPSTHIRCMITASFLASATLARWRAPSGDAHGPGLE